MGYDRRKHVVGISTSGRSGHYIPTVYEVHPSEVGDADLDLFEVQAVLVRTYPALASDAYLIARSRAVDLATSANLRCVV